MELFGLLKSSSISARCVRASSRSKEPREPRAFITVKRLVLTNTYYAVSERVHEIIDGRLEGLGAWRRIFATGC